MRGPARSRRARHAEHLGGAWPPIHGSSSSRSRPAEQMPGDRRQKRRLPLALLGVGRAPPRARRELADHDRGHRVGGEREPVLGVRQRERVHRRQEEEVEREHARGRDRGATSAPPRRSRSEAPRGCRGRRGRASARSGRARRSARSPAATAAAEPASGIAKRRGHGEKVARRASPEPPRRIARSSRGSRRAAG